MPEPGTRGYGSSYYKDNLPFSIICVIVCFGFLYGLVMTKSVIFLPSILTGTSSGAPLLLLKFFLASACTSLLGGAMVSQCGDDMRHRYNIVRSVQRNGLLQVVAGGACMGCGIVISGTAFEAAFVQAGAGLQHYLYSLMGGIASVFVIGIISGVLELSGSSVEKCSIPNSKNTLDRIFQQSYTTVALVLGILLTMLCYALETVLTNPWPAQIPLTIPTSSAWFMPNSWDVAWSPYFAGACLGILQLTFRLTSLCPVDATYVCISPVAISVTWLSRQLGCSGKALNWFSRHCDCAQLWATVFFFAAAGGAAFSDNVFGSLVGHQRQPYSGDCFWGGALLMLGAVLADMGPLSIISSLTGDLNLTSCCGVGSMTLAALVTFNVLQQKIAFPSGSHFRFMIHQ